MSFYKFLNFEVLFQRVFFLFRINSHSETLVDTRIARDDVVNIPDEQPMMNSFDSGNKSKIKKFH